MEKKPLNEGYQPGRGQYGYQPGGSAEKRGYQPSQSKPSPGVSIPPNRGSSVQSSSSKDK